MFKNSPSLIFKNSTFANISVEQNGGVFFFFFFFFLEFC
jgi:hypothetical protein